MYYKVTVTLVYTMLVYIYRYRRLVLSYHQDDKAWWSKSLEVYQQWSISTELKFGILEKDRQSTKFNLPPNFLAIL